MVVLFLAACPHDTFKFGKHLLQHQQVSWCVGDTHQGVPQAGILLP